LQFKEKPIGDSNWVNGGFFVFNMSIFDHIEGDGTVLEKEPLERLSQQKQLSAYKHEGFWQPMDTLRDKIYLEKLWLENNASWERK